MSNVEHVQIAGDGVHCLKCKYDIVGLKLGEKCPECGSRVMQFVQPQTLSSRQATASLVLGILSILTFTFYGVGLIFGILALVFSKKSRLSVQAGNAPGNSLGIASAGRITGWIGSILSLIVVVIIVVVLILLYAGIMGPYA